MNKQRICGFAILGTVALSLSAHWAGVNGNLSESAPIGLWFESEITEPLHHGMMVGICPPSTIPMVQLFSGGGGLGYGRCHETNTALLLKPLSALPGDVVRIRRGEPVLINHYPILNTEAAPSLDAWPDGEYVVGPGEVWVFSSHSKRSFDSRYFGPVRIENIKSQATPIWTFQ